MAVFLVTEENGPAWDDARPRREQAGWDAHGDFMDRLVDEGFVLLGGPLGDGERALLAVEAADADEVRTRLAPDPWLRDGVLRIRRIEPWTIWLDGVRR
jgi:uncharacterized protein YciI